MNLQKILAIDYGDSAFGPTLLIAASSAAGVGCLVQMFGELATERSGFRTSFTGVPGVVLAPAVVGVDLVVAESLADLRLIQLEPGRFRLEGTCEHWDTARLLVEPLMDVAGHQFLTSLDRSDAIVEVSSGEGLLAGGRDA